MAKKNKKEPQYLGVKEFASEVRYSTRQIRRFIDAGSIMASRAIGRRKWQIHRSEVTKFREGPQPANEQSTISEPKVMYRNTPTEQASQAQIDPLIVKRRDGHYTKLAGIAKSLLDNDLYSVVRRGWTTTRTTTSGKQSEPHQGMYILTNELGVHYELTKEQLSEKLDKNVTLTRERDDKFFRDSFSTHLKNELSEDLKGKLFFIVVEEHPYELIGALSLLAERKTFKGTCHVCEEWK